jgi:hypothetical protein
MPKRLLLLLLLAACQPKTDNAIDQVPEDKVIKILAEVALADGAVSTLSGVVRDSLAQAYYKQIFELNGMTLEEFEKHMLTLSTDTDRIENVVRQSENMVKEWQRQDSIQHPDQHQKPNPTPSK